MPQGFATAWTSAIAGRRLPPQTPPAKGSTSGLANFLLPVIFRSIFRPLPFVPIALTSPFRRGQIRRAPAEAYIPPPPGYTALLG